PYGERGLLAGTGGGGVRHVDMDTPEAFPLPAGKHPGAMGPSITWNMSIAAAGDILCGVTSGLWIVPASSRQFWTVSGLADGTPVFFTETRAFARTAEELYLNAGTTIYALRHDGILDRPRRVTGRVLVSLTGHRPLRMERAA